MKKPAAFKVMTGQEPIRVVDVSTGGEAYFEADEKVLAYKHATWIKKQGHIYRIEFRG